MPRKLKGIRRWKSGWQAYVKVHGQTFSKSFPLTTALETMRAWRVSQKQQHARVRPGAGSFGADIQTYLSRVSAMPTYRQRKDHLELWAMALGRDRSRATITATEIDAVMQGWLSTPSAPGTGKPGRSSGQAGIAPGTVRKRRTALVSFFRTLDGKDAPNPARASSPPRVSKPEARGLDYQTIERVLSHVPECVTKRRLTVLAYTGLPPGLLATVTAFDLDLKGKTVRVHARRKGAGVEARTLPLTPDGARAFAAFHKAQAYGTFAIGPVNVSFKRACKRVGLIGPTLYDLRHSFLTLMYRTTKDLATVARFGLHASLATTARYAQAAMKTVDEAAARQAGALLKRERRLSSKAVLNQKGRKAS